MKNFATLPHRTRPCCRNTTLVVARESVTCPVCGRVYPMRGRTFLYPADMRFLGTENVYAGPWHVTRTNDDDVTREDGFIHAVSRRASYEREKALWADGYETFYTTILTLDPLARISPEVLTSVDDVRGDDDAYRVAMDDGTMSLWARASMLTPHGTIIGSQG